MKQFETIMDKSAAFFTGLLFTFPILPLQVASVITLLMVVLNLLTWILREEKNNYSNWIWLLLFGALPVIYFSELLVAVDFKATLDLALRKLLLITFPVGFFFAQSSSFIKNRIHWAPLIFASTVAVLLLKTFFFILVYGVNADWINSGGWAFALRQTIEMYSNTHPTYLSLFVAFSGVYLIHGAIFKWKYRFQKYALITACIFLFILFILASRIVIVATVVILLSMLIFELKQLKIKLIFIGALSTLLIGSWLFIPSFKERVTQINSPEKNVDFRPTIYQCDMMLAKENWLWGIQAGQIQPALNTCYVYNNPIMALNGNMYNTHNEYFNVLIGKGIVALLVFVVLLVALLRIGLREVLLRYVVLLCALTFLTENLLDRQLGVFFFSLFSSLFIFFRRRGTNFL